jgi:hypothetical protein
MLLVKPLLLGRTAPTCLGLRSKAERKLGLAFNEYDSFLEYESTLMPITLAMGHTIMSWWNRKSAIPAPLNQLFEPVNL